MNLFMKRGEFWEVAFERDVVHLRDAKGLQYIATLLRRPRTAIHAAELRSGGATEAADDGARVERDRLMVTQRIKAALRKIRQSSPALGEHLEKAIRTGRYCRYDPQEPVPWDVS